MTTALVIAASLATETPHLHRLHEISQRVKELERELNPLRKERAALILATTVLSEGENAYAGALETSAASTAEEAAVDDVQSPDGSETTLKKVLGLLAVLRACSDSTKAASCVPHETQSTSGSCEVADSICTRQPGPCPHEALCELPRHDNVSVALHSEKEGTSTTEALDESAGVLSGLEGDGVETLRGAEGARTTRRKPPPRRHLATAAPVAVAALSAIAAMAPRPGRQEPQGLEAGLAARAEAADEASVPQPRIMAVGARWRRWADEPIASVKMTDRPVSGDERRRIPLLSVRWNLPLGLAGALQVRLRPLLAALTVVAGWVI
jgi:hypothetical protein